MIETRPDIVFVMSIVSHFSKNSSHIYTKVVKIIYKYLKVTKDQGIIYGQDTLTIEEKSDSD